MQRTTQTLSRGQALVEAHRCLGCHEAPCAKACPVHVNVPVFIRRFREDNLAGASAVIYETCALGHICGNACPTATLCEGACVLPQMGQTAVRIGALQAHITGAAQPEEPKVKITGARKVAVIGAGPAGLGCAVQLNRLGYDVHIYDRNRIPGGMVDTVIPAHRLPLEAVQRDMSRLQRSGVEFHTGEVISPEQAERILAEHDAVFIGVGMGGLTQPTDTPGMDAKGVYPAMQVLEQARRSADGKSKPPELGRRVIVVGGGNVALDAAVVASRLGSEQVIVLYRRSKAEMPGWESEYLEACELGVGFRWLSIVEAVLSEKGRVSGVRVGRMRFTREMAGGRRWVERDPDLAAYDEPCDSVIFALGQELEPDSATAFGIEMARGKMKTRSSSFQTSNPKIFAGGEALIGGSTIVGCLASGKAAADEMHAWLTGKGG